MGRKKVIELQVMKENMRELNKKFVSSLIEILRQNNSASFVPAACEYIIQSMNVISSVQKRTGFACMEGVLDETQKLLNQIQSKYVHVKLKQVEVKYEQSLKEKMKINRSQMRKAEEILINQTEDENLTIGTRKRKNLTFPPGPVITKTSSSPMLKDSTDPFKRLRMDSGITNDSVFESQPMVTSASQLQGTPMTPKPFGFSVPPLTSTPRKRECDTANDVDIESDSRPVKRLKDANGESVKTEAEAEENSENIDNVGIVEETSESETKSTAAEEKLVESYSTESVSVQVQVEDSTTNEVTKTETTGNDDEVDESDDPPMNEFKPVVENNAVYSKPCKVFEKVGGEYKDKGIGVLYVNPMNVCDKCPDRKYQIVIRADTSLGRVLFNAILNQDLPFKKVGKNNVMTLGADPTTGTENSNSGLKTYLIRVRSSEDADELIKRIEEFRSGDNEANFM